MRLRKFALMAAAAMCIAGLTACGASDSSSSSSKSGSEATTSEATSETSSEATSETSSEATSESSEATSADDLSEDEKKVAFSYNGTVVMVGDDFESIKDGLGKESSPAEEIEPCDPDAEITIMYTYDGLSISTSKDSGKILYINAANPEDGGSVEMGTVAGAKVGDKIDDVKAIYGDAENESEYVMQYSIAGKYTMSFTKDDSGKKVASIYIGVSE